MRNLSIDVGCGKGLILHAIAKRHGSGKAVGIDRIEIASGDARAMPFADNSFDAVASSLVIHSISGDGDRRRAIREVYRHL
ncbi:class I SAM-dependent methyltransferase [Alicyclobacillus suci]|uniref:class I SAM-dependent methyltransferase n=1 Tax=Alicyclobacillus suci TaxID=2816080 RepID=UPI001A90A86F